MRILLAPWCTPTFSTCSRIRRNPNTASRSIGLTARSVTLFGVDVFSKPFPRDGRGQVDSCDAGKLIVLRLEDLRDHGPDTLGWFF